jgi:hypothetical protein
MSTLELRGFNHPRIRLVLSILQRAAKLADEGKCHRWEFAVELDHLLSSGATVNDLRAMLFEGTIEAAVETTSPRSKSRRFRKAASMAIPPHTCFILSDKANNRTKGDLQLFPTESTNKRRAPVRPYWDKQSQTLSVAGEVVKQLRRPSTSQMTILNAFEEEGWADCIDDPLRPKEGVDPKMRLHSAINNLNRGLAQLIHFHSNGNGRGVCWRWNNPHSSRKDFRRTK